MKANTCLGFIITVLLSSCKTYNYYATPVNAPAFINGGEVRVTGCAGISGMTAMGGASITKNFSVTGMYNSNPGVSDGYHSKQGETAAGFHLPVGGNVLSFYGGFGWGSNYDQDSGDVIKSFQGYFSKPFAIISFARLRTKLGQRIKGESSFSLKTNYLIYNGFKNLYENNAYVSNRFYSEVFFWEPFINTSIGGKHVRFDAGMGFVFKRLVQIDKGARVHPVNIQFGLTFLLGRKYTE